MDYPPKLGRLRCLAKPQEQEVRKTPSFQVDKMAVFHLPVHMDRVGKRGHFPEPDEKSRVIPDDLAAATVVLRRLQLPANRDNLNPPRVALTVALSNEALELGER
jgi:hypothetical protein